MKDKKNREYRVWNRDEEESLRAGVLKHGLGAWEVIRKDPEFSSLECRTGVQLKDKWRNLIKFRHISIEECKSLKPKDSGPWSKRHANTDSILSRYIKTEEQDSDDDSPCGQGHEGAEGRYGGRYSKTNLADTALPKRQSQRARTNNKRLLADCYETWSSDSEAEEPDSPTSATKRRRTDGNNRFGLDEEHHYMGDEDDGKVLSNATLKAMSDEVAKPNRTRSRAKIPDTVEAGHLAANSSSQDMVQKCSSASTETAQSRQSYKLQATHELSSSPKPADQPAHNPAWSCARATRTAPHEPSVSPAAAAAAACLSNARRPRSNRKPRSPAANWASKQAASVQPPRRTAGTAARNSACTAASYESSGGCHRLDAAPQVPHARRSTTGSIHGSDVTPRTRGMPSVKAVNAMPRQSNAPAQGMDSTDGQSEGEGCPHPPAAGDVPLGDVLLLQSMANMHAAGMDAFLFEDSDADEQPAAHVSREGDGEGEHDQLLDCAPAHHDVHSMLGFARQSPADPPSFTHHPHHSAPTPATAPGRLSPIPHPSFALPHAPSLLQQLAASLTHQPRMHLPQHTSGLSGLSGPAYSAPYAAMHAGSLYQLPPPPPLSLAWKADLMHAIHPDLLAASAAKVASSLDGAGSHDGSILDPRAFTPDPWAFLRAATPTMEVAGLPPISLPSSNDLAMLWNQPLSLPLFDQGPSGCTTHPCAPVSAPEVKPRSGEHFGDDMHFSLLID